MRSLILYVLQKVSPSARENGKPRLVMVCGPDETVSQALVPATVEGHLEFTFVWRRVEHTAKFRPGLRDVARRFHFGPDLRINVVHLHGAHLALLGVAKAGLPSYRNQNSLFAGAHIRCSWSVKIRACRSWCSSKWEQWEKQASKVIVPVIRSDPPANHFLAPPPRKELEYMPCLRSSLLKSPPLETVIVYQSRLESL